MKTEAYHIINVFKKTNVSLIQLSLHSHMKKICLLNSKAERFKVFQLLQSWNKKVGSKIDPESSKVKTHVSIILHVKLFEPITVQIFTTLKTFYIIEFLFFSYT